MEKVITIRTGGRAYLGRPQFGKTGTHEAYRDAWFVLAGSPQVTTSVWVGYPDAQIEMRNLTIKGESILAHVRVEHSRSDLARVHDDRRRRHAG